MAEKRMKTYVTLFAVSILLLLCTCSLLLPVLVNIQIQWKLTEAEGKDSLLAGAVAVCSTSLSEYYDNMPQSDSLQGEGPHCIGFGFFVEPKELDNNKENCVFRFLLKKQRCTLYDTTISYNRLNEISEPAPEYYSFTKCDTVHVSCNE